jgi:phage shock protein C
VPPSANTDAGFSRINQDVPVLLIAESQKPKAKSPAPICNFFPAIVVSYMRRVVMYCNACGRTIAEDARFCTYCGIGVGTPIAHKKLMRSRADRKVGGVCAGLAAYLEIDTILMRLLWAFVTLVSGIFPGVVVYVLAWIIVPEDIAMTPMVTAGQPLTSQ